MRTSHCDGQRLISSQGECKRICAISVCAPCAQACGELDVACDDINSRNRADNGDAVVIILEWIRGVDENGWGVLAVALEP